MNNGLAPGVPEGANGTPWRFLSGGKHAGAAAVQDEPQFQSTGGAVSGLSHARGRELKSFQDGQRQNRHKHCGQLINSRDGKQECRIDAISGK